MFFIFASMTLLVLYLYKTCTIDQHWNWWRDEVFFSIPQKKPWYDTAFLRSYRSSWFINQLIKPNILISKINKANVAISVDNFIGIKSFILQIISLLTFCFVLFFDLSIVQWFLFALLLVLFFFLPDIYLQIQSEKRIKKLANEVPYFIDLFALTIRTGVNIEQAFTYTTQQKNNTLNQLLKKQLKKIKRGVSLIEVIEQTKKIVNHEEFTRFCLTIQQSKKLGVSLSETLELHSNLMRTRRKQKAEELSRTAGVKITLPLVLFIFPALLLLYLGPGLIQMME